MHWDWMRDVIKNEKKKKLEQKIEKGMIGSDNQLNELNQLNQLRVLNLFAYTGIASIACALE